MLTKIFDKIQEILNTFTGLMLGVVTVLIFVQVIMRYVFGQSLAWSEELARYMFVWIIYLGINIAIRDEMETKIDILDLMFKEKGRQVLQIIRYAITLAVLIACFASSIQLAKIGRFATTPTLKIPAWVPYIAFLVGFPMSIIEVCRRIYFCVKKLRESEADVK